MALRLKIRVPPELAIAPPFPPFGLWLLLKVAFFMNCGKRGRRERNTIFPLSRWRKKKDQTGAAFDISNIERRFISSFGKKMEEQSREEGLLRPRPTEKCAALRYAHSGTTPRKTPTQARRAKVEHERLVGCGIALPRTERTVLSTQASILEKEGMRTVRKEG